MLDVRGKSWQVRDSCDRPDGMTSISHLKKYCTCVIIVQTERDGLLPLADNGKELLWKIMDE